MNHAAMKENIFALYDGELRGKARREAEVHLKSCTECRALYERWGRTSKVFFRVPPPPASGFLVQRVMNSIQPLDRSRWVAWPALQWRWLVPALGAAAAASFIILQPRQQPLSIETLLLAGTQAPTAWALSDKTPTADELLGFVMEG